jgi:hypothetical protein
MTTPKVKIGKNIGTSPVDACMKIVANPASASENYLLTNCASASVRRRGMLFGENFNASRRFRIRSLSIKQNLRTRCKDSTVDTISVMDLSG